MAYKEMKDRVIAIDFGTCNTYLSQSIQGGPVQELNISVGGDNNHGINSIIMYRTKGEHAGENLFGQDAASAYGGSSPKRKEANGLELAAYFKPDIEASEKARQDAICFLSNLLTSAENRNLHLDPLNSDVFFGVPSEASEGYKSCLRDIARKAGWGDVHLLDEPFGALCSYQDENSKDVVKQMVNESVLVVDFGGGTCDFVILDNLEIKYSWGDMLLGGRLFDDLFYQWVIDCSQDSAEPVTEELLIKTNKDFYWRSVKCRETKERFSNAMVDSKSIPFEDFFAEKYDLALTWDEFVRRAQNYHPSQSFLNETKLPADLSNSKFNPNGTTDILNWFEEELHRGFEVSRIPISSIGKVLLAGGSSTWPFVCDACEKAFGKEKLIRCANPFAAISMGLVKYCKIQKKAIDIITVLEQEATEKKESLVQRVLDSELSQETIDKLNQIAAEIFERFAMPELNNFSNYGGMLNTLENNLSNIFKNKASEINDMLSPVFDDIGSGLKFAVINDIKSWFDSKGINTDELKFDDIVIDLPEFIPDNIDGKIGAPANLGAMIATAIVAAIIAILIGCSFAFWPLWFIIGPILAVGGAAAVEDWARKTSWSPEWAAWLISGDVIPNLREKFYGDFVNIFANGFAAFKQNNKVNIENSIDNSVDQALALYRKVINMELGTRAVGAENTGFSSTSSAGDAFK
ncbi:MAG: Hsp70 family protein [Thermoguttaceae bacterium]|nr:Hsp70 family protein [Thermoguttaceae bacterium]